MMKYAVKGDSVFDFNEPRTTLCWEQVLLLYFISGGLEYTVSGYPSNLHDNQLAEIQNRCSMNRLAGNAK